MSALQIKPALHQMCATDVTPSAFVGIARQAGADAITLFLNSPQADLGFPVVRRVDTPEIARALDGEGVSLTNLDFFMVAPGIPADRYRPAFELGARLGGQRVVVLIGDEDRPRALEGFSAMCALAADCGLSVGLEFMPLTPGCPTLAEAADFIRDSRAPNAGIGVDSLHLARSGGFPRDLAASDASLISHAQLADGPAATPPEGLLFEATKQRVIPGDGDFPLASFLAALPAGVPLDVEVPLLSQKAAGIPALERTKRIMAGAKRVILASGSLQT